MRFCKVLRPECLSPGLLALVLLLGSPNLASADVPDMMINTDGTTQLHNEEQIWVSPIDSNVVMIVWRDFRLGYRRVQRHFTWRRAAEKTVDAYRETIRDYR